MWFESMHPRWADWLGDQRPLLELLERDLVLLPDLAPSAHLVMAAFGSDPAEIKVVILGQDPYPTPGVAVGRAFAINTSAGSSSARGLANALPASLRNIFKELVADVGGKRPDGSLSSWERQGVMLLNRHLTTTQGVAGAHLELGWNRFTEAAIAALAAHTTGLVLVLWGNEAQSVERRLASQLAASHIVVVKGPHPSPLSAYRGFFGSKPFSAVNHELSNLGKSPINWNL